MSLFKKRKIITNKIIELLDLLKFNENETILKGSFMYENIKNYSDIDFYTNIKNPEKYNNKDILKEINNIINRCYEKNIIFIEFLIMDKEKNKFNTFNKFNINRIFNNFVKKHKLNNIQIVFAFELNNKYYKASSDYYFTKKKNNEEILKDLIEGINKALDNKQYMKILKRIFNIYQIKYENKEDYNQEVLYDLVKFFNSKYGKLYVINEDLKFINDLIENNKNNNKDFNNIINKNLSNYSISKNKIKQDIINNDNIINENSKKIFLKLFE